MDKNYFDILPAQTRNAAFGDLKSHSVLPSLIDSHSRLRLNLQHYNKLKIDQVQADNSAAPHIKKIEDAEEKIIISSDNYDSSTVEQTSRGDDSETSIENLKTDYDSKERKSVDEEESKKTELRTIKLKMEHEIEKKLVEYKRKKSTIEDLTKKVEQLKLNKSEVDEILLKSNDEHEKHLKVLQLIPNAEENLEKLVTIVQKTKNKLEELETQWSGTKIKLDNDFSEIKSKTKDLQDLLDKSSSAGPSIQQRIDKCKNEIERKKESYKQLLKIFQSLKNEGQPREFYTKRILDLVKQIEKLRCE